MPGHVVVVGNEQEDAAARAVSSQNSTDPAVGLSYSDYVDGLQSTIKTVIRKGVRKYH